MRLLFCFFCFLLSINIMNSYASSTPKIDTGFKDNYHADELYGHDIGSLTGNSKGRVTLVDFSDYQCKPCRESSAIIENRLKTDENLRVVYIDYPMLGARSTNSAKAALAAINQGKYIQFHNALMSATKPLSDQEIISIAKKRGLDVDKLKNDMDSKQVVQLLLQNMMLGNAFGVIGLPTFIVGYTSSPHKTIVFAGADPKLLIGYINNFESKGK